MSNDTKVQLLAEAKKLGISGTQAKVLSTDPYFVGTEKDYVDARWASTLWDKMMAKRKKPIHLRGFHYYVQSQHTVKPDGEKYAQKDAKKDWTYLLHCVQMAKYLNIGEFKNLVDMKHPDPADYGLYFVGSGLDTSTNNFSIETELTTRIDNFVNSLIDGVVKNHPRYRTDGYQTTHCEVWCEKNSMGFVIEPQCRKYQATYQALVGQSSVEKVTMLCGRSLQAANAGQRVRIFYISDNDRYGASMPIAVARKLEFMLGDAKADVKVNMLALTNNQVKEFNLPRAPKLGEMVVELDALEAIYPGELGKIVTNAIAPYYDSEKPAIVAAENRRIREEATKLVEENLRKPLEELFAGIDPKGIAKDLDMTTLINPDFTPPEPGKVVDEKDIYWVYDSDRPYWEQYKEYKKNKVTDVGGDE